MARAGYVEGLKVVPRNLNREIAGIKGRSIAGLMEAGLQIQAAADPHTPKDTGNLRASAYTRKVDEKTVEVGYGASYAPFVHENLEAKFNVGEAKWFENTINRNHDAILEIVARRAQVGQ